MQNKPRAVDAGVAWATMRSKELLKSGVPGIHYYTLGRSDNGEGL
ncbi:MAG: hypothetical protein R2744_09440 [Bacteroidales bacterium]